MSFADEKEKFIFKATGRNEHGFRKEKTNSIASFIKFSTSVKMSNLIDQQPCSIETCLSKSNDMIFQIVCH